MMALETLGLAVLLGRNTLHEVIHVANLIVATAMNYQCADVQPFLQVQMLQKSDVTIALTSLPIRPYINVLYLSN